MVEEINGVKVWSVVRTLIDGKTYPCFKDDKGVYICLFFVGKKYWFYLPKDRLEDINEYLG